MPLDWKNELTVACIVKEALRAADTKGLWRYHLPEVAATEEQLKTAERVLGAAIDDQYKQFLRHANGWKKALQNIDIHGTAELISEEVRAAFSGQLEVIDEAVFSGAGIKRTDIYVLAGARIEGDMFCMAKKGTPFAGQIFWIAGTVVDRFPCFDEFFLSLVDYNRRELQRLQGVL